MSVDKADENTKQWQLIVIHKIEAASYFLNTPERQKMSNVLLGVFMGALLLWSVLLVPNTILRDSQYARDLVEFTAAIFPWIDNARANYGVAADKFVYWQCVSVWGLMLPIALSSLAYRMIRLNIRVKGQEYYISALLSVVVSIVFIVLLVLLNNVNPSFGTTKLQKIWMFNEYFSAVGSMVYAALLDFVLIEIILSSFYLMHFIRNYARHFNNQ